MTADHPDAARMRCTEWRPFARNTLRGFAVLQQPSGMILSDASLHEKNGKWWVAPPGKPKLDASGSALRKGDTGKIDYVSIVSFTTDQIRRRWSDEAVAAIRRDYPEAFAPQHDAAEAQP